ncbi:MAG: hypothetical protein M1840_000991 [Geoglossum simile]|nr:MAG: hypothetical protein M1840_000991 [Geoglossum simile]
MTAPTERLGGLTISTGMPLTRAQAKQQLQTESGEGDDDSGSNGNASSPQALGMLGLRSPASFKQGNAGRYDNRHLSEESWQRAKDGLSERFTIESCSEITPPRPETYYVFQLAPHISQPGSSKSAETDKVVIRIGAPDSQYQSPTCSCQDFEVRGTACKHVFWLLDQILDYSQAYRVGETLPLWDDGCALQHDTPYDQIRKRTLTSIAADHRALFRRRSDSQVDTADDEPTFSRKDQVLDILSTFDPETLPEEYPVGTQQRLAEGGLSSQTLLDSKSLEGTVFGLAVRDNSFFTVLRRAVPPDYCTSIFLDKALAKVHESLNRLDKYVESGPLRDTISWDVAYCASNLGELVSRIRHHIELRAPLGRATKTKAFRLLVTILEEVTKRNYDVYADISWAREAPSTEKDVDRNLYQKLVGSSAKASKTEIRPQELPEKGKGNFVLDALRDLTDAGRDESHKLQQILQTIEENGAPQGFIAELKRLKGQLPSSMDASQSTGHKRVGADEDRGRQKRMK